MSPADSIEEQLPSTLEDLTSLVAIQSVSADPARAAEVERSAQAVADLIRGVDPADVAVVRAGLGAPAVIARIWCKPAISVIGLDATPVAQAANALIPVAQVKVSLRVAPDRHCRS
jgi:hypothetical protein